MNVQRRKELIDALIQKGANHPCSRCGGTHFEVVEETSILIQERPNSFAVGGPSISAVIVACSNCGHIWHHATVKLAMKGGK